MSDEYTYRICGVGPGFMESTEPVAVEQGPVRTGPEVAALFTGRPYTREDRERGEAARSHGGEVYYRVVRTKGDV